MATLGNQTTGFTFSVSGSFGQAAGGPYTVPSPGIFVSGIHCYADNNGSSATDRLYVWKQSGSIPGAWLARSSTFSMDSGRKWRGRTDISTNGGQLPADGYIAAGTVIWIGINSSDGSLSYEGKNTGTTEIGNTNDGNWSDQGAAGGGMGQLAAYIDYSALAAPTLSSVSPSVGTTGQTVTVSGTNLLHTTGVTVNGTAASFSITNDTTLAVTVPSGATPGVGTIVVTTPAGSDSVAFTVGQIFYGTGSAVASIVAVWYGDGSGVPHKVAGVWVPDGVGVKRIW